MRYLALALLTVGITASPGQSLAADLSGHWRYFQRDAIEVSPRTYDHSADFILWQRGNRVYGTWSESGHRGSLGCVRCDKVRRVRRAEVRVLECYGARCYANVNDDERLSGPRS